jgi:hypothetical protein
MNNQPASVSVIDDIIIIDDNKTVKRLRKAVGYLAMGLPLALFLLSYIPFFKTGMQKSISYCYYTNFRDLYTGVLCAVSLFLICYRSSKNPKFWLDDNKMTNLAGIMALGMALVPTNPDCCSEKIYTLIPVCSKYIGWIHIVFALLFFGILAEISICIFTIGQKVDESIPVSCLNENYIYKICGYIIIACIAMIMIGKVINLFPNSIFWFEAIGLAAFGFSWLIKGRFIGDKGQKGRKLYREVH